MTAPASLSLPTAAQTSSIPVAAPATFSHQFTKKLDERIFLLLQQQIKPIIKAVSFIGLLFLSPFIPMGFLFESDRDQNPRI